MLWIHTTEIHWCFSGWGLNLSGRDAQCSTLVRSWGGDGERFCKKQRRLFQPWRSYFPPGGQHSQIFAEIDVFNMQKHSEGKIFCISSASKISLFYLQNSSVLSVLIQQEVYFWAGQARNTKSRSRFHCSQKHRHTRTGTAALPVASCAWTPLWHPTGQAQLLQESRSYTLNTALHSPVMKEDGINIPIKTSRRRKRRTGPSSVNSN